MAAPICVARIGAAHGVRGAVKLWTFTEDPLAGIAQAMGFGGGGPAPSPDQLKAMQEKLQSGGLPGGMPNLPKDLPPGLRQGLPNLPGLTGLSGKPNLPGLTGLSGKPTLPGLGFPGKKK